MSFLILVGSYTDYSALAHLACGKKQGDGIYIFEFSDGTMNPLDVVPALNPAVLIPHPKNCSLIYAISETIQDHGDITPISLNICPESNQIVIEKNMKTECNGFSTCYLAFHPNHKHSVIVSYWDSIIDVANMDSNGEMKNITQTFQQVTDRSWRQVTDKYDHWSNRMAGPHAHSAHFWKNWLFIPDLGENAVFQYGFDDECNLEKQAVIRLPIEGCGPRHVSIHPHLNVFYVSNELNSTVCVMAVDDSEPEKIKPRLSTLQITSTLVCDENNDSPNYVAEVSLSADGRFLYVSNRGHDSICVFSVDETTGELARVGVYPTGGKTPRHFSLSPCGHFIIVANQDSCDVSIFERNVVTGAIGDLSSTISVPSPNFILCVPKPVA